MTRLGKECRVPFIIPEILGVKPSASSHRHWFLGLNRESPVMVCTARLWHPLKSIGLWKVREPERREEGRLLFDFHTSKHRSRVSQNSFQPRN